MKNDELSSTAFVIAESTYFMAWDKKLGRFIPPFSRDFSLKVIRSRNRLFKLVRVLPFRWLVKAVEVQILKII
jgi:hypothetical protein